MIALTGKLSVMKRLRIVMICFAKLACKGNYIITLALQAHNGEQREPHNSKLKTNKKKRERFGY